MSIAEFPQLQALTRDEKFQLIDELLVSVGQDPEPWTISDEEKAILDEWLDEHEANPGTSIPLEEFKRLWAQRK